MNSKQSLFADLQEQVNSCNLCPRMAGRRRVLSPANGSLDSQVIFIAEAPGRLGAEKYGIPLYGDQTGRNFEWLISNAGITRNEVFITNAILCNPRAENGTNDTPSMSEIQNCSVHLKETLNIIKPEYVATLGKTALSALNIISPLDIKLSRDVGQIISWNEYRIYPLYHPGPRACVWRSKQDQTQDYVNFAKLLGTYGNWPIFQ